MNIDQRMCKKVYQFGWPKVIHLKHNPILFPQRLSVSLIFINVNYIKCAHQIMYDQAFFSVLSTHILPE